MVSIGTVIATQESPNLDKIEFILNKDDKLHVERGQFIIIPKHKTLNVLGMIIGIKNYNAYYKTLDSSVQDLASRDYEAIFPIQEWESTVVEVKPLGEIDQISGKISRLKFPVSPGSKIYIASSSIISKFLGLDENGIYWGDLYSNEVKIKINLSKLLRKHLAILSISGAGKSYAASILLEELNKYGKLGVLVIDPHGEYSSLFSNNLKNGSIEVIKGSFISISVPELSAWEISEFIPEISPVQTRVLENVLSEFKKTGKTIFGLKDVIKVLELSEAINSRTKEALIGWLESLHQTYLFSAETSINLSNLLKPGKMVILDLSDIQSLRSRRIIVLYFLKQLYFQRVQNEIPPCIFIIEEAHQFCPQTQRSVSKNIIETIAREGRKFYASLCLISQRPVNLSVTALSQCNTNLILRIRNPYDLDFIGRMSEGIDRSSLKIIPDLEIGEALLVGEAINYPIFFRIRLRSLNIEKKSFNLEEMAERYAKIKEKG